MAAPRRRQSKEISMLGDKDAAANIAVKDLETAKKFYVAALAMMSNFGIPLTSSMSIGFTIGFMKG
jgi:hypothetical protein